MRPSVLQSVGVTLVVSLLLCSASAATVKRQSVSDAPPTKVIAGNDTKAREWFCGLEYEGLDGIRCGGQLIAPDVVLTAAHCVVDENSGERTDASELTVYCGGNDQSALNTWQDVFKVTAIRVDPAYDWRNIRAGGDLAMFKLDHATTTKPIKINTDLNVPFNGQMTAVIGFGRTDASVNESESTILQYAPQPAFTDREACAAGLNVDEIVEKQMCFGAAFPSSIFANANPASCQGDSGGPFFIDDFGDAVLVGTVSWGNTECDQTTPGTYGVGELVAPSYAWIQKVLDEFEGAPAPAPAVCPALSLPPMAVAVGCDNVVFGGSCRLSCTCMRRAATCVCNNGAWQCEKLVCMPKNACRPWGCTCAGLAKKWLKTTFKEQPFETVFWQTYCQGNPISPYPSYGKPQIGHYRKPYPALPMPMY